MHREVEGGPRPAWPAWLRELSRRRATTTRPRTCRQEHLAMPGDPWLSSQAPVPRFPFGPSLSLPGSAGPVLPPTSLPAACRRALPFPLPPPQHLASLCSVHPPAHSQPHAHLLAYCVRADIELYHFEHVHLAGAAVPDLQGRRSQSQGQGGKGTTRTVQHSTPNVPHEQCTWRGPPAATEVRNPQRSGSVHAQRTAWSIPARVPALSRVHHPLPPSTPSVCSHLLPTPPLAPATAQHVVALPTARHAVPAALGPPHLFCYPAAAAANDPHLLQVVGSKVAGAGLAGALRKARQAARPCCTTPQPDGGTAAPAECRSIITTGCWPEPPASCRFCPADGSRLPPLPPPQPPTHPRRRRVVVRPGPAIRRPAGRHGVARREARSPLHGE